MVGKPVLVPFLLAAITRSAAVLLVAAGTGWGQWAVTEEAKLFPEIVLNVGSFGWSTAVQDDMAVFGAPSTNIWADTGGQAYVFARSGTTWTEQAKLMNSDAEESDRFGDKVSLSGDTVVVGAHWHDHPTAGPNAGAAYVFVRNGTVWNEQAKLTPSDAEFAGEFGISVGISGDTIMVGMEPIGQNPGGTVYVFVRSGTSWTEHAKLTGGDTEAQDNFGASISLSGDVAVIGANYDDHAGGQDAGSVYVFVRSGTSWVEEAKLTASDSAAFDRFGNSVSLSGDTVLVGAALDDHVAGTNAGAAYVFVRNGTVWAEQAKLTANDAAAHDIFGHSVGLWGDTAVVGALTDDHSELSEPGSAYVFIRDGTSWAKQTKLIGSDPTKDDHFGMSVGVSGHTLVIGAYEDDPVFINGGSAYVYRLWPPPMTYCTAGTSASGCQALLSATGTPSATATSGFTLQAGTVEGQKDGLFFFGTNGQQANPWGNGTSYQCVVSPVVRTPTTSGVGTIGLCDGSFTLDLNALWCPKCPKPAKNPGAAAVVQAQLWYRDPLSTSNQTTSLSDAIEFSVGF